MEREVGAMLGRGNDTRNIDTGTDTENRFSLRASKNNAALLTSFFFFFSSSADPFKISDPQEYELINLCSFKPLSL